MELVFNDFSIKIYLDHESGFFYFHNNKDMFIKKIHLFDNDLFLENIEYDIIQHLRLKLITRCLNCDTKLIQKPFCNLKCKNDYRYNLRLHQKYLISEEIISIKERVHNCEYCGKILTEKQADHILPLKEYKHNHYDNIAIVCAACNYSKNNKDLLEWAESKNIKLPKHIINHYYWLKKNI